MSAFILKIIALTAMVFDHVNAVFPDHTPFEFRLIGRLTFPIFVYLIAEGFNHTRNPKKFLLRLLAFALISEAPYDWTINRAANILNGYSPWHVDFLNGTNIFYTLLLGGVAIFIFQYINGLFSQSPDSPSENDKITYLTTIAIAAAPVLALMWLAEFLGTDYGGYGVLFIVLMYVIKSKGLKLTVFAIMNVLQHRWIIEWLREGHSFAGMFLWIMMIPATLLTVPLIIFYNGKRGPSLKWLFYAAYPAHLAILAVLAHVFL